MVDATPEMDPVEPAGTEESGPTPERRLGDLLLHERLITTDALEAMLRRQGELETYKPIGQLLVEEGLITRRQLDFVLDRYRKRSRLGEILRRAGALTEAQLEYALAHQQDTDLRLGDVLLRLNLVPENVLRQGICFQLNVPFLDLDKVHLDRPLGALVSKSYARLHRVVPLSRLGQAITVAMDDPTDSGVVQDLQASTGCMVQVVMSTRQSLARAFKRIYEEEIIGPSQTAGRLELIMEETLPQRWKTEHGSEGRRADDTVRQLIAFAIEAHASDIHLEALDNHVHTRFRVDGVLEALHLGPLQEIIDGQYREIVSRIKILGNLDIAERRRPQDGSFRARVAQDKEMVTIYLRISIIPSYYGENVVLRLLDPRNAPRSPEQLGFSPELLEQLRALLQRTAGMILLTGPTGSGKSSTLYSALMTLYRPGIRILTAEDPIEYVYEEFSQSEVNDGIGNTFASYLRAFLRHDPEVIMVGEIRDAVTAEMAFRAAQTGHLLLSTLHTTDAVSVVSRLRDLGVDPNLITSCMIGALSQRLVRLVCVHCQEACTPSPELIREFFDEPPAGFRWYRGRGCPDCHFTGYKGRTPLAELWVPSERDIRLINRGASLDKIRESSEDSTIPMANDIRDKLQSGRTTLDELIRTLPYSSISQFRQLISRYRRLAGREGAPNR